MTVLVHTSRTGEGRSYREMILLAAADVGEDGRGRDGFRGWLRHPRPKPRQIVVGLFYPPWRVVDFR